MCASNRQFDRKSRALLVCGCALLAIATPLRLAFHPGSTHAQDMADLVSGFALGLAIALNLCALLRMRKMRAGRI